MTLDASVDKDDVILRFHLTADSHEMEPIPDLEGGGVGASNPNGQGLVVSSSSVSTPEHTVVNRMTPLEFLWRRHVRSRTNNATMQAVLDRILLVFLFLASLMEQPLKYLLGGTTPTSKGKPAKSLQTQVTKGTVKTTLGVLAYRICQGRNPKKNPILCFHADGRSSDEFLEILPLLADTGRRVVAIDLPGFGWSENPKRSCTVDEMADACLKVADAMLIQQFVCLGSSIGAVIAASLASRYVDRVRGCIHINLLYKPTTKDSAASGEVKFQDDGSHLVELHNRRKIMDPDLNLRCMEVDLANLNHARARQVDGVTIQSLSEYDVESVARKSRCPTLCVGGESALASLDVRGLGGTQRFDTGCRMLPHCEVNIFSGPTSTAHMLNQAPKELTSLCAIFLDKHTL
jgi:pimeloyl-ACP methyl ester carboxylesterase